MKIKLTKAQIDALLNDERVDVSLSMSIKQVEDGLYECELTSVSPMHMQITAISDKNGKPFNWPNGEPLAVRELNYPTPVIKDGWTIGGYVVANGNLDKVYFIR